MDKYLYLVQVDGYLVQWDEYLYLAQVRLVHLNGYLYLVQVGLVHVDRYLMQVEVKKYLLEERLHLLSCLIHTKTLLFIFPYFSINQSINQSTVFVTRSTVARRIGGAAMALNRL